MRYGVSPVGVTFVLFGCAAWSAFGNGAAFVRAAEPGEPVLAALCMSLAKNIGHAREWLDGNDFKSLSQSAGGQVMLCELLRAKSDDAAWQAATGQVLAAISDVQAAARSEDPARCRTALDGLEKAVTAAAAVKPAGQPQTLPRAAGGVRPVMLLMDAVRGDAKIALLTGNTQEAKKGAYVLSELGRVVSNSQSGNAKSRERWPELSGAFVEAALAAARSPAEDAPSVRQLLRAVSQRCDACHETRQ